MAQLGALCLSNLCATKPYLNRNGQYPSRIILGYKTYTELMNQKKFSDELKNSAIEPNKRKYRKIKIKLTQDDHQLELR
ncbi:MAG: hypothetical protein ACKO7M_03320 [Acinetobacter junii]